VFTAGGELGNRLCCSPMLEVLTAVLGMLSTKTGKFQDT
jgi:hypothetical protein